MYARFANLNHQQGFQKTVFFQTNPIRQQGKMWVVFAVLVIALLSIILMVNFILPRQAKPPNPNTTTVAQMENTTTATVQTDKTPNTPIAGRIESYNGLISAYTLERAGKPVEVGFLAPVYKGDKITVNKPDNSLQLTHQRVEVTVGNSPYTVATIGDIPSTRDNILGWIGKKLSGYHEDKCDPKQTLCDPITVVTRSQTHSDDLSIPLLEDNSAFMVAGTRPFYLRWFGGESPYQVEINQDGQSIVSLSAENQWLTTKALPLKVAATYQVTIKDANGQTITEAFSSVAAIDYPKDLEAGLSPESRQTVNAMWLGSQRQWVLEAYQQASEIADKHYPARLLRDRLEKGLRVKKPKE
ncbi:MAG: hypothetical protein DRR19_02815 [Candidatus Parabeggiatoa sp. nov. 1]|nr:MAG: hypothetical protein DRR19_02815 [Gammaproteobacteria bacterium]